MGFWDEFIFNWHLHFNITLPILSFNCVILYRGKNDEHYHQYQERIPEHATNQLGDRL